MENQLESSLSFFIFRLLVALSYYKWNGYAKEILLQDICNYVRSQCVDLEIVNVLQGRIEEDVFVRHYNRPDLDTVFVKVRNSIESLEKNW